MTSRLPRLKELTVADELPGVPPTSREISQELVEALRMAVEGPTSLLDESFRWRPGVLARVGGTVFRIKSEQDGMLELEHYESKEIRIISLAQLCTLKSGTEVRLISEPTSPRSMLELLTIDDATRNIISKLPLDGASAARVREFIIRVRWLNALEDAGYRRFGKGDLWEPDLIRIAAKHQLPLRSSDTLATYRAQADRATTDLIPDFDRRGGKGGYRTDHRPRERIHQIIDDIRGGRIHVPLTPGDVFDELRQWISMENAKPANARSPVGHISLSTATREFNRSVSHEEKIRAKHNPERANKLLRPFGARPTLNFAGGVAEFDDTDTRIFCISRSGLGWGRPWLTAGVDQHSGYFLGRSMDNKPRSGQSAISAYVNAVEAKNLASLGEGFEDLVWYAMGYPIQSLFDNATYNNPRFVRLYGDIGDPVWAKPFQPTQKRQIETFNGDLKEYLCTLPGWRGALDDRDAIKAGIATAVMQVEELERLILKFSVGPYAKKPRGDGLSREQKYLEVDGLPLRPRIPPDVRRLKLMRTIEHPNSVRWTQSGIKILGLTYQDPLAFKRWISRPGGSMRVTPRIDPDDLTVIYVPIPDSQEVLVIPSLSRAYVLGLTLYQHLLVMKMCRLKKLNNPQMPDYLRERESLRVMTEQTIRSGKIRERKRAEQAGVLAPVSAPPAVEAVHDVQIEYEDLDKVEMEKGSEGWGLQALLV